MTMQNPKFLHDSRFADAVPVASSTATGYSVLNIRDRRPYTWWKPAAMPATVTVDCASAKAADCLAVWGHDLGSKSATIEVRGSTDNFSASDVLVATLAPVDDKPFVVAFNSVSYRYWRIRLTGASAPSLAIAMLGAALTFPKALPYGFDPLARTVKGTANRSEGGQPLGRSVDFEEWRSSLSWKNLDEAWVRDTFMPAWKNSLRGAPFIFAWDLGDHQAELYLVVAGDKMAAPCDMPLRRSLTLEISGLALQ